jgi:hypothetical protein
MGKTWEELFKGTPAEADGQTANDILYAQFVAQLENVVRRDRGDKNILNEKYQALLRAGFERVAILASAGLSEDQLKEKNIVLTDPV